MMTLSAAAAKDVDPTLGELIKIRASQLNHCAFCLDMHTHDARKHGETEQRLDLLAGVGGGRRPVHRAGARRAGADRGDDRTAHDGHVSDEVYARAAAVFSERELGQVIAMAVTINAWNRIDVTTRLHPPHRR